MEIGARCNPHGVKGRPRRVGQTGAVAEPTDPCLPSFVLFGGVGVRSDVGWIEHQAEDRHLFSDLARRVPAAGARDQLVTTSIALRDHLAEHLAVEDADVIPLFLRHYSADEFDAVQDAAVGDARRRGMTFYEPCIVDAMDGDARRSLIDDAPLPLKFVWWATRRRHRRLVDVVFAGTDAPTSAPVSAAT